MSISISLEGLRSFDNSVEDRSLADIKVDYNGLIYSWQVFIPQNVNISEYLESKKLSIQEDIDSKEILWNEMTNKTRIIEDTITGESFVVDIDKSEVVKPDVPDYYAKRRAEYPSIGEQLGALWKGTESDEFVTMKSIINQIKLKYPKN